MQSFKKNEWTFNLYDNKFSVLVGLTSDTLNLVPEGQNLAVVEIPLEPTAERLAEMLFQELSKKFTDRVQVDYVTVYEN